MTQPFKFELGVILKDKVTGFQGVTMARSQYYTGCNHYGLAPQNLKDGRLQEWEWIDEVRLEIVRKKNVVFHTAEPRGGPEPHPKAR